MFENSNIKRQIIKNATKYRKDSLFQSFINSFYSYIPIDDKKFYDVAEFTEISDFVYQELFKKKHGKHHVTILPVESDSEGEEVRIAIINDDMPFLVDSINEFLHKRKYKVKHMINALICVDRDNKGKILSIKELNESNIPNESAIYIRISLLKAENYLEELLESINSILLYVRSACSDWKPMVKKLEESNDWLPHSGGNVEDKQFLDWLINGNFTFLGYREYKFLDGKNGIEASRGESLGVVKIEGSDFHSAIVKDIFAINNFASNHECVFIGKIRELSHVHRRTNLDYICVVKQEKNKPVKARVFLGLFSTKLDYQSVTDIPLIRSKVESVVKKAGFNANSFNQKELFSIIETLPRDELFQLSDDELFLMSMMILSSLNNPRVLFFARENRCKFFVNLLIFFPKSRVTSDIIEKVQAVVSQNIKGKFIHSSLRFSIMGLAYLHISMKVTDNRKMSTDIHKIEQKLDEVTRRWDEMLPLLIERKFGSDNADRLFNAYKKAFPTNYQFKFTAEDAVDDIEYINAALLQKAPIFNLYKKGDDPKKFNLKTYNLDRKVDLHKVMPIIENIGFSTIEENVFKISTGFESQNVFIQDFYLVVPTGESIEDIKINIEDTINAVFEDKIRNDVINKLTLRASLSWRDVFLLDAYCAYMQQIKFTYSQIFIKNTLVKNSSITNLIVKLFYARLDPDNHSKENVSAIEKKIKSSLLRVTNSAEDKVIKKLIELVCNTLRTNYFQKNVDGFHKNYISFKLDSKNIEELPLPKPYAEIFVYSVSMEGIHLRGGKISRGGLRWSDRVEDYRTEVLGLMKAQMAKNAIIVPNGAKGGFLVKNAETFNSKESFFAAGVECYKTLLRGMLDITDNVILGEIVKPKNVVCLDGDDPYIVAAADKGTATFSDIANQVASEYKFWLGDAFASGGAFGYDHKKIGITSRGGWIAVTDHFKKLGIDAQTDAFTATGIGDMSGDVFGNGMLLSNTMKLVAAFNHIHIFIDPSPDVKSSYKERKRLFEKPGSSWSDYNKDIISKGGGIFSRDSKSIKLSKEIKTLLDIKQDKIDPDSLIRSILMAKVDLLWNGGIGTYVKAESEVHEQIGNKSNDSLRINGKDLRCRVVGEGGNLGFTQLGRIEAAFNGVLLNTDFIDNSGGVSCSDHEVNIKIALDAAIADKKLTKHERDKFLATMQDEVANLVLSSNIAQTQNISISISHTVTHFEFYVKLIETLKEKVDLDTEVEFLPSKAELERREQDKSGFSRPEIAVLMAYSKMATYQSLINSSLPKDKYYEKFLIEYFPTKMRQPFEDYILHHQLRKEIISTVVANDIVDHVGAYFFQSAQSYTGLHGCDVARAYTIVWEIFQFSALWEEIAKVKSYSIKMELFTEVRTFLQRAMLWFLRSQHQPLNVSSIIHTFHKGVSTLFKESKHLFVGSTKDHYDKKYNYYRKQELSEDLSFKVASLSPLYSVMDIVDVSNKAELEVLDVAKIYFDLGEKLYYNWLQVQADQLRQEGYWERMLVRALKDDIYDQQRELTMKVAKSPEVDLKDKIDKWMKKNSKEISVFTAFIQSIQSLDDIDSAKLVVATKQSGILIN